MARPCILSTSNSNWQITSGLELKSRKAARLHLSVCRHCPTLSLHLYPDNPEQVQQISLCILSLKAADIFQRFWGHLRNGAIFLYILCLTFSLADKLSVNYALSPWRCKLRFQNRLSYKCVNLEWQLHSQWCFFRFLGWFSWDHIPAKLTFIVHRKCGSPSKDLPLHIWGMCEHEAEFLQDSSASQIVRHSNS